MLNLLVQATQKWVESGRLAEFELSQGLSLRAGAPCDNFQGYCDVFLKCRQVRHPVTSHLFTPLPLTSSEEALES